jgi:hypothetical protein
MLPVVYRRKYENTASTTWVPETDKIRAAPAKGTNTASAEPIPPKQRGRRRQDYSWHTLEVRFNGGPEASWLIRDGGKTWRYPGHLCLHDALAGHLF